MNTEEMNVLQLFLALMGDEYTHPTFKKDHTPIWSGLHWFIKDLHQYEGVEQTYDFFEVRSNINDGYMNGEIIMHQVGGLTDKYFRDGNH